MPDLPEVTQDFDADTGPYVAGLEAAIAAAERFKDANLEALASARMLKEGMAGEAAAAESAAANQAAAEAAGNLAREDTAAAVAGHEAADAARAAAAGSLEQAAGAKVAAAATDDATASTFRWGGMWRLTGNAIHWIIAGTAELLAVVLPAAVAAGAAAFVLYQGAIEQVGFRLTAMYGATEATGAMIGKTTGDVLGLGHAFQSAQDAANPIAYQLLGEYIDAARSHMVDLAGAGLQVDRALGELGARIDVDLISQGGQLNSLLAHMVPDLVELGQLFGSLGHSILNLASDMPGLAEVLLRVALGASQVVLWISHLNPVLITTFMVFEEFSRWGGLVVTVLGRMGMASSELSGGLFTVERFGGILSNLFKAIPMLAATAVSSLGSLMSGFGRLSGPVGKAGMAVRDFGADMTDAIVAMPVWQAALLALAAAGIGYLIYRVITARSATQEFTDSLQQMVDKASNTQVFGTIAANISKINDAQKQAAASAHTWAGAQTTNVQAIHEGIPAMTVAQQKMQQLGAGYQQQVGDLRNVAQGASYLAQKYGISIPQAMSLADVAGVKLSKGILGTGQAAQIARQQIEGLVVGYKGLDAQGGILGNDMNALAIQTGLQDTKVQQLNSAWDQFLSNATGLTSSFSGLITDVGQINNAITTAGKKFTTFGGQAVSSTTAASLAMRSFSGVGAQVWQNYDQALQQAGQFTDQLRTASAYGAVSQKQFTESVAFSAQQLLPYAKNSKTATEELGALAQEAGGPATSNYKTLKDWVDKNTTSAGNFNKIMQQETGQLSDVSAAASEFASTLQNELIQDMVTAGLKFSNVNGLMNRYAQMIHDGTAATSAGRGARAQLIRDLEAAGLSAKQAAALIHMMAGQISGLHGKRVLVTVDGVVTAAGRQALAAAGVPNTTILHALPPRAQTGDSYTGAGIHLVGETGPELVRFRGGEGVLPSWQTAPIMHGGGSGGSGAMTVNLHVDSYIGGQKVASQQRTQTLTYNRLNTGNNLRLRTR